MTQVKEIINLEQLLELNGKKVTSQQVTSLTAIGENYGSQILAVTVKIEGGKSGEEETIEAVAKIPPPSEFLQKAFNTKFTFKYEIDFYKTLLPELMNFVKKQGVNIADVLDCFPKHLGSRLSLDPNSEEVDDDAVLLLENLKKEEYGLIDRLKGFDLNSAKSVLKTLAKLHAVPIAMKVTSPLEFRSKILSHFPEYTVFNFDDDSIDKMVGEILRNIKDDDECKNVLDELRKVLTQACKDLAIPRNSLSTAREPFASITHRDAWVNNFMIKCREDGTVEAKIVDFQIYEYISPLLDIFLFIFTSVKIPIVENHFQEMMDTYHTEFIKVLKLLQCDVSQFSREAFQKELEEIPKVGPFSQIIFMLNPILAINENLVELSEMTEETFTKELRVTQQYKERFSFVVKTFKQNKWLFN